MSLPSPRAADAPVASSKQLMAAALARLRRGETIVLGDGRTRIIALAPEMLSDTSLAELRGAGFGTLYLALSPLRALALGVAADASAPVMVRLSPQLMREQIAALADATAPAADLPYLVEELTVRLSPDSAAAAALALAKRAGLLPAAVIAELPRHAGREDALTVDDVLGASEEPVVRLTRLTEARVPLVDAEDARIIAFRLADGSPDYLAIVIGTPDVAQPVLVRVHSSCLTGDVLGSLRCDCGDQLRGAIAAIGKVGSGILVYLPQEGRGIGLANKLRAYVLQDTGIDTVDANRQLGFDADERGYRVAGEILRALGVTRVRLMTNNPGKVDALAAAGIAVVERVPHKFPSNKHNRAYLRTKAMRFGHQL